MLIFLDTEFTNLNLAARLISIGLVDESGERTFYGELSDTYFTADCSAFVREAVLPLLEGGPALMTLRELGERLATWIADLPGKECASFVSDSVAWDWPLVWDIFQARGAWPDRLSREPVSIHPLVAYPAFEHACERAYPDDLLRRHHALDDARANRPGWAAAALPAGKFDRGPAANRGAHEGDHAELIVDADLGIQSGGAGLLRHKRSSVPADFDVASLLAPNAPKSE